MEGRTYPLQLNCLSYGTFESHSWFFSAFNFSFLLKLGEFSCTLNQGVIVIWPCSTWASFASLMNALPSSVCDKQASEESLSAYMGWTSVSALLCFSLGFFAKKLLQISKPPSHKAILGWEYLVSEHFLWVKLIIQNSFSGILSDAELLSYDRLSKSVIFGRMTTKFIL